MNIKDIVTRGKPCAHQFKWSQFVWFTFPSTTQQSLIIYRVGALSVASTIISYLANSHDKKETRFSSEFHFWLTNICFGVYNLKHGMNELKWLRSKLQTGNKHKQTNKDTTSMRILKRKLSLVVSVSTLNTKGRKNKVATVSVNHVRFQTIIRRVRLRGIVFMEINSIFELSLEKWYFVFDFGFLLWVIQVVGESLNPTFTCNAMQAKTLSYEVRS
jgi:hypothetical protein